MLQRNRILTGERVQNASSGFSQDSGGAEVNITLDSAGGKLMSDATRNAVGKRMAVLFIENKQKLTMSQIQKLVHKQKFVLHTLSL